MIDRAELNADEQYAALALILDRIDKWTVSGEVIHSDWQNWLDLVNGVLDNVVIKMKPPSTIFPDIGHAD